MEKFELKESRTGLIHLISNDGKAHCSWKAFAEAKQSMHRGDLLKVHPRFFCKKCFGQVAQERLPKLIKQGKISTGEIKNKKTTQSSEVMINRMTKKIIETITQMIGIAKEFFKTKSK